MDAEGKGKQDNVLQAYCFKHCVRLDSLTYYSCVVHDCTWKKGPKKTSRAKIAIVNSLTAYRRLSCVGIFKRSPWRPYIGVAERLTLLVQPKRRLAESHHFLVAADTHNEH